LCIKKQVIEIALSLFMTHVALKGVGKRFLHVAMLNIGNPYFLHNTAFAETAKPLSLFVRQVPTASVIPSHWLVDSRRWTTQTIRHDVPLLWDAFWLPPPLSDSITRPVLDIHPQLQPLSPQHVRVLERSQFLAQDLRALSRPALPRKSRIFSS
jgi:hypothetical protein